MYVRASIEKLASIVMCNIDIFSILSFNGAYGIVIIVVNKIVLLLQHL
jgi:hypothetical protein